VICHRRRALRLSVSFCLIYKGLFSQTEADVEGVEWPTWLLVGFQPLESLLPLRRRIWVLMLSAYQYARLGFFEKLPSLCTYYIEMVSAVVG